MAATLTVRYYTNEHTNGRQVYPMRVVAVNAVDMPKEVFVFQRRVPSATDPQEAVADDFFVKVAEPNALEEYPVEPPTGSAENAYYRRDNVELFFRSQAELEEAKDLIDTCLRGLILALRSMDAMTEMDEVLYGD